VTDPNPIIIPTVGRVVWFYPASNTAESGFVRNESGGQYAAIIARVWSDKLVNLSVFDANGTPHSRTSVALVQGDDAAPDSAFCGWMPFQKGQAARQDAQAKEPTVFPRITTHRQELEHSAAHALASRVAEVGQNGGRLGKEVRDSLDALLGDGETKPVPQVIALSVHDLCAAAGVIEWPGDQGLTFGDALAELKKGRRVARAGWNGKGMWLALSCDGSREVPAANFWAPANRAWAEQQPNRTAMVLPSITMKTANGEILMGWLASQTDMLAEDWVALT
jgi:hypothetical protein